MLYLASSVTLPLFIATLLLALCIGETVVIFYLLGSKNKTSSIETTNCLDLVYLMYPGTVFLLV